MGNDDRDWIDGLGPEVARARAMATLDSGEMALASVLSAFTVDEDLGEDDEACKSGDRDLCLGVCSRAKGLVIWFVWIL